MDDLISRQAAIDKCQERLYESALNNIGYECKADEVFADIAQNRIKTWLNEVPSEQPEQKKGVWKFEHQRTKAMFSDTKVTCNKCGYIKSRADGEILNYCPHCGADMRGEA